MKKNKLIKLIIGVVVIAIFAVIAFMAATANAYDPLAGACENGGASELCSSEARSEDASGLIETIVNLLLFLVGTLSVIMIIAAGIFYVISSGDAGKVARAKNTLTYAIVGLIVAFIAYAIVNWVLDVF